PVQHGFTPMHAFFGANILMLVYALWPRKSYSAVGLVDTDGMQLWKYFSERKSFSQRMQTTTLTRQAADKEAADALHHAQKVVTYVQDPKAEERRTLYSQSIIAMESGDLTAARAAFTAYNQRCDLTTMERLINCNNLAYLYAIIGESETLAEADKLSQYVLGALPTADFVKGTRGAVLIALGQFAEGEKILAALSPASITPAHFAQNNCWLALAMARQGRMEESKLHLELARKHDPKCFLIPRFEPIIIQNPPAPPTVGL
ncbi:MAG TPA: hypothetical protein VHH73_17400, partial [Verrucomicrobiae bacterium]|nr:hypothetical protein [Verrucomicrobiae bacterium]